MIDNISRYIKERSQRSYKQAGGLFKHPFIDPGSVYQGNLWDWDSFWTVYALMASAEDKEKLLSGAKGGLLNFFDLQMDDGYLPMMVSNQPEIGSYLLDQRKAGKKLNMHKPFLCQQAQIISSYAGSHEWLRQHLDGIRRYFACYDRDYLHEKTGLYVWADDVMIGMDNDPAVFGRPRYSTASMFLNGFMVAELKAASRIFKALDLDNEGAAFIAKANALVSAIQTECYDSRDRFFYSVDVDIKTRAYDWFHQGLGVFWNSLPIKVRTWTGFIPLYAGFATESQARDIVRLHIEDATTFMSPNGIRALARDEKMYNLEATINPSNWLGPIWMVVNYVVFRGLMNYGFREEAGRLMDKSINLLNKDLETSGELHEYYNPETGHPIINPGFLNWNMLSINMYQEFHGQGSVFDALDYLALD
ncbi:MAG: MGH1-like glycoside hydrolase domain-containing protein [Christensenellales bacterium]|jgi:putative isomerase